jgi:hypothetical protein
MTSIFLYIEDELKFLANGRQLQSFVNGRQLQLFVNGRQLQTVNTGNTKTISTSEKAVLASPSLN